MNMRKLHTIEIRRLSVEDFKKTLKTPLIVVLNDVRSLLNVGSILRTADAFRVERVYLCGITGTPPSNEIHKTALGAEDSVEWRYFDNAILAVEKLKMEGCKVYAVEQAEGSIDLRDVSLEKDSRYAVVFGNEVKGVEQNVIDMCDGCIEIAQYGTKHSLNVSVAAGIVIYHIAMKLIDLNKHI